MLRRTGGIIFFLKKRKIDWFLFSNVHMHSQSGFASSCAREKHKILFKIFLYIKNKNKKEKKKMEPVYSSKNFEV